MQTRQVALVEAAGEELRVYLHDYFQGIALTDVSQADVVLALLRDGSPAALTLTEQLIGRAIERLPDDPRLHPRPHRPLPVAEARVTYVGTNPFWPTSSGFERFDKVRKGMTMAQLHARGLTWRMIKRLIRQGHLVIGGKEPC